MNTQEPERREYRARGIDDQVHLVEAGEDALLDPSPHRARCGQAVIEIYNDRPETTCPVCGDAGTDTGTAIEPCG